MFNPKWHSNQSSKVCRFARDSIIQYTRSKFLLVVRDSVWVSRFPSDPPPDSLSVASICLSMSIYVFDEQCYVLRTCNKSFLTEEESSHQIFDVRNIPMSYYLHFLIVFGKVYTLIFLCYISNLNIYFMLRNL